jgi:hypothetical protein
VNDLCSNFFGFFSRKLPDKSITNRLPEVPRRTGKGSILKGKPEKFPEEDFSV